SPIRGEGTQEELSLQGIGIFEAIDKEVGKTIPMIAVISPAKTLDYETPPVTNTYSQPAFLEDSRILVEQLKTMSPEDISSLIKIRVQLGVLNANRYQTWQTPFTPENAKQAVLAFKGDVYVGLEAETFSEEDFKFAQDHLRILSGLYGLLRPLDLV